MLHLTSPSPRCLVMACFLAATTASQSVSEAIDSRLWVANGEVRAVVRVDDILYIGGLFSYVHPNTGGGAILDLDVGEVVPPYLAINGLVDSVAPDGEGGWYVAGSFTSIGNVQRNRLAHVRSDGSVSDWNPNAGSRVIIPSHPGQ